MGLTAAGFALALLLLMWALNWTTRTSLILAAILGALMPLSQDIASGVSNLGSSVAPLFNSLGGGLG
jgi:cell shape-determining protein MreD